MAGNAAETTGSLVRPDRAVRRSGHGQAELRCPCNPLIRVRQSCLRGARRRGVPDLGLELRLAARLGLLTFHLTADPVEPVGCAPTPLARQTPSQRRTIGTGRPEGKGGRGPHEVRDSMRRLQRGGLLTT
jgi:hypothetical protein